MKLYVKAASTGSTATMLAKDVADTLRKICKTSVNYKVATLGRDTYKITWYYYYLPGVSKFVNSLRTQFAIEEDDFEYDVNGLPIMPADVENTIGPDVLIENWVNSGKFDIMAKLYYGLAVASNLYIKSMPKEATGSNARAYEKAFGHPIETDDKVFTMTLRVKQVADVNKTSDVDWNVKCIDSLFRYHKVFDGDKKVRIPNDEITQLNDLLEYNSVTKRKNTISLVPKANKNIEDVSSIIDAFIDKYYPEMQYDLSISNDTIIITL